MSQRYQRSMAWCLLRQSEWGRRPSMLHPYDNQKAAAFQLLVVREVEPAVLARPRVPSNELRPARSSDPARRPQFRPRLAAARDHCEHALLQ